MTIINLNATVKGNNFGKKVEELGWGVSLYQGDLYECVTENGVGDDFWYTIHLTNFFTGVEYLLNSQIRGKWEFCEFAEDNMYVSAKVRAEKLLSKIVASGQVDLQYWLKISE